MSGLPKKLPSASNEIIPKTKPCGYLTKPSTSTSQTKIQVYFADPYSPWQRGTNKNTNGLIRQYFSKGTDFRTIPLSAIYEVEQRLNSRPRKTLGFDTPAEKFYELLTGRKVVVKT